MSSALSLSEAFEFPSFLEVETSEIQRLRPRDTMTHDALPVQDCHARRAIKKSNRSPHATELDPSPLSLAHDLHYLRHKFVPHVTYQCTYVCRGICLAPRQDQDNYRSCVSSNSVRDEDKDGKRHMRQEDPRLIAGVLSHVLSVTFRII